MVLSGTEYSMAVMAAFPLPLVVILSRVFFSINIDILDFLSDMPRTELSSAISQDYLDFYPRLYPSSARVLGHNVKMGWGHKFLGPTDIIRGREAKRWGSNYKI